MRNDTGSVYVEFSIVVPLFILLTVGIYSVTLLLGNMAILVPTSYEALYAGAGKIGTEGESAMGGVSNLFVTILGDGLEGYSFTPQYNTREQTTDSGIVDVPVVEVELMSGVEHAPSFATLGLDLTLVGPHVGRDLTLASENFETLDGPYDCHGNQCSGNGCPGVPCGINLIKDIGHLENVDAIDLFDGRDPNGGPPFGDALPNIDIVDLHW